MGNGNIFDYAQVLIAVCTGDEVTIDFDGPSFKDSKVKAHRAMGDLSLIGMSGDDIAHSRTKDPENWFKDFPDDAHIVGLVLQKANHQSPKTRPVSAREYTCSHTGSET